jgi:hypothetical protein
MEKNEQPLRQFDEGSAPTTAKVLRCGGRRSDEHDAGFVPQCEAILPFGPNLRQQLRARAAGFFRSATGIEEIL